MLPLNMADLRRNDRVVCEDVSREKEEEHSANGHVRQGVRPAWGRRK